MLSLTLELSLMPMSSQSHRILPLIACAGLQAAWLCPAYAALPLDATQGKRATAYASPALGLNKVLQGHAAVTHDTWMRFYNAGVQALDKKLYEQAEVRLNAALTELRRKNIADLRLAQTKEALGRALLGQDKYDEAERVLTDTLLRTEKLGASADGVSARASEALAETLVARHKFPRADEQCRHALAACEKAGVNEPRATGRGYMALGDALAARGLDIDAGEAYKKAISILERDGLDPHDLADANYHNGILLRAQLGEADAAPFFHKAFAQYDKEAQLNRALIHTPRLTIRWEEGSPRSRVIPDQDYPLKYVMVDGVRVAATLVRSENVIVALISLANCSRHRKELALGQVSLQQLSPKYKYFRFVHPTELDTTLEAEHVTELTWRRRWLNHIEKTRRIPGYLKDGVLDVDNFFGNNTFGAYGNWQTVARTETPIVTREQFLYSNHKENAHDSADFLSHTPVGTRPTFLDAGDAKTGQVYFGQERFNKALLKIVVGNTVVEIPFDSAGPR